MLPDTRCASPAASQLILFVVSTHTGALRRYVHVVADNTAAIKLYERAGYQVESQETEAYARAASRPRRLLLVKPL